MKIILNCINLLHIKQNDAKKKYILLFIQIHLIFQSKRKNGSQKFYQKEKPTNHIKQFLPYFTN